MLFSDSYFSISEPAEGVFRDKGSKFLGFAFPLSSESTIKEKMLELKKQHPSAAHYCYAWRLGAHKQAYRINDDGEPSGSAGKPIYSQILSNDLTNILIVVVRYFGGTLLGIPGLIHAYKECTVATLQNTKIIEEFIYFEYQISFTFDNMSKVMRVLKENEAKIMATAYEETNVIVFRIKKRNTTSLENDLKELYTTQVKFIQTL